MTVRNIRKSLIGMEDMTQGVGPVQQTNRTVNQVLVPFPVSSEAELAALDVTRWTYARVVTSATAFTDYLYDPNSQAGIAPDEGTGSWIINVGSTPPAANISYDNSTSGLVADDVQEAIDELATGRVRRFTVAEAQAEASLIEGDLILLTDRADSLWDVQSAGASNGYNELDLPTAGLQAVLRIRHTMSPVMFGCVGDGSTDDTLAMNAAIAYTAAIGSELVSNTQINFSCYITDLPNNARLKGIQVTRPVGYTGLLVDSDGSTVNVTIDGCVFNDELNDGDCVRLHDDHTNLTIKNCEFNGLIGYRTTGRNSFEMLTPGVLTNVLFDNNVFNGDPATQGRGNLMAIAQVANGFTISNNTCNDTGSIIHTLSQSNVEPVSKNIRVINNQFYRFHGTPYQTRSNADILTKDVIISGNIIEDKYYYPSVHGAIVVGHSIGSTTGASWENVSVFDNQISRIGSLDDSYAIIVGGGASQTLSCKSIHVYGNIIDMADENGSIPSTSDVPAIIFQADIVSDSTIKDNIIRNTARSAIILEGCKNVTVEGNTLVDCVQAADYVNGNAEEAGIYVASAAETFNVNIKNNTIVNTGNNIATNIAGIGLEGSANWATDNRVVIDGNTCIDDRGTDLMAYGIRIGESAFGATNQPDNVMITNNRCYGSRVADIYHFRTSTSGGRTAEFFIKNNSIGQFPSFIVIENSATPSVNCGENFVAQDTTTVTDLIDAHEGQIIEITNRGGGNKTFTAIGGGGNFNTISGADIVLGNNRSVRFFYSDLGIWYEM